jgi:hypothetical protein
MSALHGRRRDQPDDEMLNCPRYGSAPADLLLDSPI